MKEDIVLHYIVCEVSKFLKFILHPVSINFSWSLARFSRFLRWDPTSKNVQQSSFSSSWCTHDGCSFACLSNPRYPLQNMLEFILLWAWRTTFISFLFYLNIVFKILEGYVNTFLIHSRINNSLIWDHLERAIRK